MKIIHSAILALAIGAASISSVQARDSFSLGINVGGYGYAPPVAYYPAPVYYSEPVVYYREPVYRESVYYGQPVTYYRSAPRYYGYAPSVVSFRYNNYGGNRHHDYNRNDWGHRGSENHGWDRGNRGGDRDGGGHGGGHHNGDHR